tara:strand:- start:475 stop:1206 length:732 start_codon:yes stop_codon:yes gene_type:complete
MLIKIDSREQNLYEECNKILFNNNNINITLETLDIGDIILYDDDDNELLIIERKTLYDLASSIKDGRYKEQSFRLSNCSLHNHNIIYLIEGDLKYYNENRSNVEKKTLISSFISINYFKGFSIYRTENLNESAEWILSYAYKLQKENKKSYYYETLKNETYVDVCSRVKKNNITTDNIGAIMLSQIPGISSITANEIMQEYKTINKLLEELKKNPNILDNIKIGKRKISKSVLLNLNKYLIIE